MESLLRQSAFMGGCEAGKQAIQEQSLNDRVVEIWDPVTQKWLFLYTRNQLSGCLHSGTLLRGPHCSAVLPLAHCLMSLWSMLCPQRSYICMHQLVLLETHQIRILWRVMLTPC
jgi:hypothetical protein